MQFIFQKSKTLSQVYKSKGSHYKQDHQRSFTIIVVKMTFRVINIHFTWVFSHLSFPTGPISGMTAIVF